MIEVAMPRHVLAVPAGDIGHLRVVRENGLSVFAADLVDGPERLALDLAQIDRGPFLDALQQDDRQDDPAVCGTVGCQSKRARRKVLRKP